jgi:hypothetical protein
VSIQPGPRSGGEVIQFQDVVVVTEFLQFDSQGAAGHLHSDGEPGLITIDHFEEVPSVYVGGAHLRTLDLGGVRFVEPTSVSPQPHERQIPVKATRSGAPSVLTRRVSMTPLQ